MGKGEKGSYKSRQKQKQFLCIALTLTLISIIVVLSVLYYSLFKPKDPQVQIPTMQLLSLYIPNYSVASPSSPPTISTLNLTLTLQISIQNPNRANFFIQRGSKARLYYDESYAQEVGFSSVPQGTIASKTLATLSVSLSNFEQGGGGEDGGFSAQTVRSYGDTSSSPSSSSSSSSSSLSSSNSGIMQMGVSVTIMGKVTTLGIFSHHSAVVCRCTINLSLSSRGIESYTCQRSFSMDV